MFYDFDGNDNSDDDDDDDPLEIGLGHDTFSLLKVRPVKSAAWLFTMLVYITQVILLGMIFLSQYSEGTDSSPFGIPFQIPTNVRWGQVIALLVTITLSRDIFLPFKELTTLWYSHKEEWLGVTGPLKAKKALPTWCIRILLPNILQVRSEIKNFIISVTAYPIIYPVRILSHNYILFVSLIFLYLPSCSSEPLLSLFPSLSLFKVTM